MAQKATLPIDPWLPAIVAAVTEHRAAVVVAPPGAGKTTRVPPALLALGPVILLQPRRVAARALARRIAVEQGWTAGGEVGWQVRFEHRFGPRTRLLVATEGVLTARLLADPLLSDFAVVVLDELHERSLHGDLALALARQAARARADLRLVAMSATLDAAPVAEFLGGCPVIEVPGRPYPVEISHAPGTPPAAAVRERLGEPGGHLLVFLPGAPEIREVERELLAARVPTVLPLHGSLDAEAQDRALAPSPSRKVILATNIAETSLTVDGVTDVIDSGLQRVLRYDAAVGLDRLETERIARDSAEQRAGRAGRTGPGRTLRLWDPRDLLRPRREPEIERVDLAGPLLDVAAWGGDPRRFEWLEPPPPDRVAAALELLESLGAVRADRITPLGETLRRFPLHPRLARVLVAAGGTRDAAAACAVIAERWRPALDGTETTDSDVLSRLDALATAPRFVREAAAELARLAERLLPREDRADSEAAGATKQDRLLRALLAGYPDRVARRREPGSPRVLLCGGHGGVLARESGVRSAEWLVALDVQASERGPGAEALVRVASRIGREWLEASRRTVEHELDAASGAVRARERDWYGALVLAERPVAPDPREAERLLAAALRDRGFDETERALLCRLRFAGVDWDEQAWIERACSGRTSLGEVRLLEALPAAVARQLERLAPESLRLPSGRRARLEYREDGTVALATRLQDLFGVMETPRLGPRAEPVTLVLLAPNGRPVQTTRDLQSFWRQTYPQVRRELRGRYPKHAWPEDPTAAEPPRRR